MSGQHQTMSKIRRMLRETGRQSRIENGKKHFKIFVEDNMEVVLPHGKRLKDVDVRELERRLRRRILRRKTRKIG